MRTTIFFLVVALVTLIFLFNLVRSRRLREKYVALWMITAVVIIVLALFPNLLGWLAGLAGIAVPSNLLFALAILLLFGVLLQLTLEISRAEDKTRVLAENVAILNLQLRELRGQGPRQAAPLPADDQTPEAAPEPERPERTR